jgi:hypothetical protein
MQSVLEVFFEDFRSSCFFYTRIVPHSISQAQLRAGVDEGNDGKAIERASSQDSVYEEDERAGRRLVLPPLKVATFPTLVVYLVYRNGTKSTNVITVL